MGPRNHLDLKAGGGARMRQTRSADVDVAIDARCGVNQCVEMLHGIRLRPGGRARGPEYPAPAKFRLKAWNGSAQKKEAAEISVISAACHGEIF